MHQTSMTISDRIEKFWQEMRNSITKKTPLIPPHFMKGRISNPKYTHDLKRTIPQEEIKENEMKKMKVTENIQVEVTDLPEDWISQGTGKIEAIANAYGENGEKATAKVLFRPEDSAFVIVFRKTEYAEKMYESLNGRQIDEYSVKVTHPHPISKPELLANES